jgi:hypothetical protein
MLYANGLSALLTAIGAATPSFFSAGFVLHGSHVDSSRTPEQVHADAPSESSITEDGALRKIEP